MGVIEAWGAMLMLGVVDINYEWHEAYVGGPLWTLEQIEKSDGASWRTHPLRALMRYAIGDLKTAKKEFDAALELDRQATIGWGWYVHFLFQTGKEELALRLIAVQAEERAESAPLHAVHGIFLTTAHRHEEAERAFRKSLELDRNGWLAHYGLAKMYLELGDQEKAEEHGRRLQALVEPLEFDYMKTAMGPQR